MKKPNEATRQSRVIDMNYRKVRRVPVSERPSNPVEGAFRQSRTSDIRESFKSTYTFKLPFPCRHNFLYFVFFLLPLFFLFLLLSFPFLVIRRGWSRFAFLFNLPLYFFFLFLSSPSSSSESSRSDCVGLYALLSVDMRPRLCAALLALRCAA